MKVKLIFPRWEKLPFQTPFNLAPLGLPTLAGQFPPQWDVELVDENVDELVIDDSPDLVGISMLLTAQATRGYEVADAYRELGVPVIAGGVHACLMPDATAEHVDAVVACEVESVWDELRADIEKGSLKKIYQPSSYPGLEKLPAARRDILNRPRYEFRGVKMFDLVQATRGCQFNCYPCCVPKLRGTEHRVRPVEEVVAEIRSIDNDRIFFIDNCLRQNDAYQREFFTALKEINIAWVAHPISEEDDILKLARESGAWYIYQAIDRISDTIRDRIKKFHDHGIAVEGTILLGRDSHDKDFFERMVDFLLEMDVELAEFTILTPFPNLGLFQKLDGDGRILHSDWSRYNTANAVFRPALMSPEELEEGYRWSWEAFYREDTQKARMARLYLGAMKDLEGRKGDDSGI